ncbi:replication factor C subunit 4 [Neodiprion virginianus]|uniref:Replication factor C subunit 2 n=1 Tax=Neodiprion lecontei TaxID=441921 RepID=A0A6J0BSR5_NEOLC|nr:replication factor C subunit 4 isoform X1 [Neodiprion lecontei]XP_046424044.1 replication factor C subunit 4 [Neodiprion fabricii]XP_046614721.1 replication factor C subunit 4 [Neodiprion virginianus]
MHGFLKRGKLGPSDRKPTSSSSSKDKRKGPSPPWVEKYRPKTVEDVVEQGEVVKVLQQCLVGGDFPNLLFYGPPGTGKTSTILAAARQLFGDMYKDRILELNASDERGIQVIRDKVKTFAQLTASGTRPDGKPCPPYKIIILDEADSMTNAAQAALRRTMERESRSTRFCLICNYVSRIIEPLTSRCTKFRFKPLGQEKIIERLELICNMENLKADKAVLMKVVDASGGDMRRAITCLQSVSRLKGKGAEFAIDDVLEVTGVIPDKWLDEMIEMCQSKDYNKVEMFIDNYMMEAYAVSQVIEQLNDKIVYSTELSDKQKAIIGEKLAECSYRLLEGGSEYMQLIDLCCGIMKAYEVD